MYETNTGDQMYETNAKMAQPRIPTLDEIAQKQAYADQCNTIGAIQAACGQRERNEREKLAFQADREQENADRSRRALRILQEHPEFEDFLWLLRSGVV